MKTIAIGKFKSTCLSLLENVRHDHEPLIVTKHRTPIVKIIPIDEDSLANDWKSLENSVLKEKDIVSPLGAEDWNACK